jgi:hypothetical protein
LSHNLVLPLKLLLQWLKLLLKQLLQLQTVLPLLILKLPLKLQALWLQLLLKTQIYLLKM